MLFQRTVCALDNEADATAASINIKQFFFILSHPFVLVAGRYAIACLRYRPATDIVGKSEELGVPFLVMFRSDSGDRWNVSRLAPDEAIPTIPT
jgi:hypothetical protein